MKSFKEKVLKVVKNIPKGKTMSYAEVAQKAGSPQASRAVGSIMAANTDVRVPCHRVIRSDGKLGAYNGLRGISKEKLLQKEGTLDN
jgi:methylated-DNA-[protein]-cysteine S-methyltransferase